MRRRSAHACALVACLACTLAGPPARAHAQDVQTTTEGTLLNFQNTDLAFVLVALSRAAGVNISYIDLPERDITILTAVPLSRDQLIALMRNLASETGVAVAEEGINFTFRGTPQDDPVDARQLYIIRLAHARAPSLAGTLQSLFGYGIRTSSSSFGTSSLSGQRQANQFGFGGQTQQQQQQQNVQQQTTAAAQALARTQTVIVPDELTNSLLIRALPADYAVLQQAIQALDIRPLQVVIEVVIAEVDRNRDLNVGTSFSAGEADGSTTGELTSTAPSDFSLRLIRTGEVNIEATLAALSASGEVRILSRPVIHAQNNQEAFILVGEERPFVQQQRSLPTDQPFRDQIVQYRDVGTTLTILPTITDDGYVNLAVLQEVSSATSEVQFDAPVISTRVAETQLLARSGQTVVIGGLVDRRRERSRVGIPFLKDIPILGYLFGTTREHDGNSELFLFMTPFIVASDADADAVREAIERNAELLQDFVPIRPIIPTIRPLLRDTTGGGG